MARKKHVADPFAPYPGLREAIDRITQSESVPLQNTLLEFGRELHSARLDYFIKSQAFPDQTDPARYAQFLTRAACRFHEMPDDQARLGDGQHVNNLLTEIAQRPGFWLYVRDEMVKFSRLVVEELRRRIILPDSQTKSDHMPGELSELEAAAWQLREERLPNGEQRTFGQIADRLNKLGFSQRGGKPHSYQSAKAAYHRAAGKQ
jgi:hypothetical protein